MKNKFAVFIQQWLADQKGLEIDSIDMHANFFEQGWLDSLGMFRLLVEIETTFAMETDQLSLFTDAEPNIASLASALSAQGKV
ncbi:MAG: acyl carrier protein [Methylococcaceae bacterium]|jgi:acyl carrier protein